MEGAKEFAIKQLRETARPLIAKQIVLLELTGGRTGAKFGMFGTEVSKLNFELQRLEKPCRDLGISQEQLDKIEAGIIEEEKRKKIDEYMASHPEGHPDYDY